MGGGHVLASLLLSSQGSLGSPRGFLFMPRLGLLPREVRGDRGSKWGILHEMHRSTARGQQWSGHRPWGQPGEHPYYHHVGLAA